MYSLAASAIWGGWMTFSPFPNVYNSIASLMVLIQGPVPDNREQSERKCLGNLSSSQGA